MDSYDNDFILLMILDDDLFFFDISTDKQEKDDVEKVSEQPYRS